MTSPLFFACSSEDLARFRVGFCVLVLSSDNAPTERKAPHRRIAVQMDAQARDLSTARDQAPQLSNAPGNCDMPTPARARDLAHERRRVVHVAVTDHQTAASTRNNSATRCPGTRPRDIWFAIGIQRVRGALIRSNSNARTRWSTCSTPSVAVGGRRNVKRNLRGGRDERELRTD